MNALRIYAALEIVLIALLYYCLGFWGLQLSFKQTNATPLWPPSGVALAAMLILGYRIWPGIWLGAFLANITVFTANQFGSFPTICAASFVIGIGNAAEAITAVFLLDYFVRQRNPLLKIQDILKFKSIILAAALVSATTGVAVVGICKGLSWPVVKNAWLTWWLGDVLSMLILTPFFLVLRHASWKKPWRRRRIFEAAILGLAVIAASNMFFHAKYTVSTYHFSHPYLLIPLIVWASYRFSYGGATSCALIILLFGVKGTVQGLGPFAAADLHVALLLLQIFIGTITVTGLILAAALYERRRAEEQLLSNSQRYQALVDNSQDMTALMDKNGIIFYASPSITKIFGYPLEEYVGHHILELIHPDDQAFIGQRLEKVLTESDAVVEWQCRCVHKDGTWKWVEGVAHNMLNDPAVNAVVVNYRDITHRKQSEDAQRYLAYILENTDQAIVGKTLEGTVTSWNKGAAKLYGFTAEEAIGQSIAITVPPEKMEELNRIHADLKAGHKIEQMETVRRTKDGRLIDVLITLSPIVNSNGHLIGVSTIAVDITERKKHQLALQESEERFRAMADTAPVMIWMSDADMICTFFNQAWLDFRGQTLDHELGHGWIQGLYPDDIKRCWTIYMKSFGQREKFTMNYRLRRADGKYRWILATGVPRFTSGQKFGGYIGSCIDITERKLAEDVLKRDKESLETLVDERSKELLSTQQELKQATRLADIGTLAATVAHELRNPLGVIQMAAYNLKKKDKNLEGDRHLINIEKKVWEGNQIIDNLLSYSRIKIPSYEKVALLPALDECIGNVQARFADYNLVIEKNYGQDLPHTIEADGHQIKEVFVNIMNNACQAFNAKAGKIQVSVARDLDNHVRVAFTDNGVGIEEEDLKRIFIPFFTRKSKGTGLGLTICNELINLHQGKIEVKSIKGQGTSVSVILPIARRKNE